MTATLTITPEDNLIGNAIRHPHKVFKLDKNWADLVEVYYSPHDSRRIIPVSELSLYHHHLIIDGRLHRILHMLNRSTIYAPMK